MRNLWLVALALLVGCGPTSRPAVPATGNTAAPATDSADCVDVATDIEKRHAGAKRAPADDIPDLDGDGEADTGFIGFCTMMGGNCDYYLYASSRGCPHFAGIVQVTEVSSGVSCAEPPADGTPCKLSASRMMIHGEIYEYFYTYGAGGYVEAGVGHRGDPPPHP